MKAFAVSDENGNAQKVVVISENFFALVAPTARKRRKKTVQQNLSAFESQGFHGIDPGANHPA